MTNDEINAMEAGPEMDALVAERLFSAVVRGARSSIDPLAICRAALQAAEDKR